MISEQSTGVRRRGSDIAAGVALIAIPIVTGIVKVIAPGVLIAFYVVGSVVFLPLYALVIVIAATGFFSRRAAFGFAGAGRVRAQVAAWLHPLAFLAATAVLPDEVSGGAWASPLSVILGAPTLSTIVEVGDELFAGFAVVSALALVWLTVEWIRALVLRRRLTTIVAS